MNIDKYNNKLLTVRNKRVKKKSHNKTKYDDSSSKKSECPSPHLVDQEPTNKSDQNLKKSKIVSILKRLLR